MYKLFTVENYVLLKFFRGFVYTSLTCRGTDKKKFQ